MQRAIETRIQELTAQEQLLKSKVYPPDGETIGAKALAVFFGFSLLTLLGGLLNAFIQGINIVSFVAISIGGIGTYWWHRADKRKALNKEALTQVRRELEMENARLQSQRLQ